jgi:hypothetical protein
MTGTSLWLPVRHDCREANYPSHLSGYHVLASKGWKNLAPVLPPSAALGLGRPERPAWLTGNSAIAAAAATVRRAA